MGRPKKSTKKGFKVGSKPWNFGLKVDRGKKLDVTFQKTVRLDIDLHRKVMSAGSPGVQPVRKVTHAPYRLLRPRTKAQSDGSQPAPEKIRYMHFIVTILLR